MGLSIEQRSAAKAAIFIAGEGFLIFASMVLFLWGYEAYNGTVAQNSFPMSKAISYSLLCQASIYFCGLYNNILKFGMVEQVLGLAQALVIAMAILVIGSVATGHTVDPLLMALWFGILLIPTAIWRIFMQKVSSTDFFCQKAILLGTDQSSQEICKCAMPENSYSEAGGHIESNLKIVAVASCDEDACRFEINPDTSFQPIKDYKQLIPIARSLKTKDLIICKSHMNTLSANEIYELKHNGLNLVDAASILESICGRRSPDDVDPDSLIFSKSFQRSFHRFFKRSGDIIISTLLLILLSPLMMVVIGGIKLGFRARAIHKQACLGFRKKLFTCISFKHPTNPTHNNSPFKRIQALPQLWNVLKGDMSLVGPSPIGPDQTNIISRDWPIFDERFTVRPGITGWAQVNCGHDCLHHSVKETIGYDLFYLKHMSLFLDIVVLFRAMRFYAPGVDFAKGAS